METVVPSATLTRRPFHNHSSGTSDGTARPVSRTRRWSRDSGSRCRALQYGSVLGEHGFWPVLTSQASTRATAARQEPSGLITWLRNAQRVRIGVYVFSRQVARSSCNARSRRSADRVSANGRPSPWANWVRSNSIWRRRRRRVECPMKDLLVWNGLSNPHSQTKEVFESIPFHRLDLWLKEVPFVSGRLSPDRIKNSRTDRPSEHLLDLI